MTREMRFGEDAGNEIIKAVRETNRRMRNAEPYRGRWFNRSQPNAGTDPNAESCCCPKCNTDLPPSASCDCLPDVCVLVYDAVGDVVDEFAGVWGTGRSFTGTVVVGECSFEVTITNGWGGGPPAVPGLRLTSPDWECLGIPECGLFVAIDCAEWRVGAEVTAQFEIDPSGCEGCEETGALTIEVRPQKKFRAECEGCDCVDEWMCATLGTLSDKQQQVGGEWSFTIKQTPCDATGIAVSVKLEARNAECGECYWKLSLPVAEIAYTDEDYWIAAGCDGVTWSDIVLYPGEENEETVNLTLAKSSCSDCGQDPCCPRGEPATLLGHLWNWFSPEGFDGADELSIANPGLFLDYCAADGATRIIGSSYAGCATPCSTGACSTDYACGDLVSGEVTLTWNCEGAVSGRYTGTFNGAFRLHETGSLTPGSTRTLHWIYQVIEIESGCDLGQEGVGFHSRITIKDHPDTPIGYRIADRVILLTGVNESCRPLLVHHIGVAGDPCQTAFDVTESPA